MDGQGEEVVRQLESIVAGAETAVVRATCDVCHELLGDESSERSGDGVLGKIKGVSNAAY